MHIITASVWYFTGGPNNAIKQESKNRYNKRI